MVDIKEVAENIYMIDDQLFSIPKFGSVYLLDEESKALIDSGPTTSANTVIAGIRKVGVKPEDIAYIIVTHVHLDHAGGAWVLLKSMPQAQVAVHHKGTRHVVNPAKLIASTVQAQSEKAMEMYGEITPIEPHRVQAIHDGDTIRLSTNQVLSFIDAPGHAPHQLCISESRNGGVFTGDAAGIFISQSEILLPAPNVNPEMCITTLKRLIDLNAAVIYFSHFGISNKVQENLQSAIDRLQTWDNIATKGIKDNMFNGIAKELITQTCAELEPIKAAKSLHKYMTKVHIPLCVEQHVKYYQEGAKRN